MGAPKCDLQRLMRLYSERGFRDWKTERKAKHRRKVREYLASALADSEGSVDKTIQRVFGGMQHRPLFVPTPACPSADVDWCFFLPTNLDSGPGVRLHLSLLVKCKTGDEWLAFRFEKGDSASRHSYTHVQLTRRVAGIARPVGPSWLPCRDPALPHSRRQFASDVPRHGRCDPWLSWWRGRALAGTVSTACGGRRLYQSIIDHAALAGAGYLRETIYSSVCSCP